MVAVVSPTSSVTEDPAGLARFRARRSTAFAIGEAKARRREISADAYLFLYKELVGLAGERTYCWPSLEFLVGTLDTSEGTLKRWMKELERADLIRRKARPGGQTSLTYITAYLEAASGTAAMDGALSTRDDAADATPTAASAAPNTPIAQAEKTSSAAAPHTMQPAQPALFFGPELQIISDRRARSEVISPTVKSQDFKSPNGYGGGVRQFERSTTRTSTGNEITTLLKNEDVCDPDAMAELQDKPLAELQALSRYLDKQKNIRCRPALFVWLARQDFGAQLLAGRQRHPTRRCTPWVVQPTAGGTPPRTELVDLWQGVLSQLSRELPEDDFATWVEPTTLLELDADTAVVGTPNVFVRQAIEARWLEQVAGALSGVLGHAVTVCLAIEPALCP